VKVRSISYIFALATIAAAPIVFTFFVFDPLVDWLDLTKGAAFTWAFVLIFVSAVAVVGLVIDCVVLAVSRLREMEAVHG
jgi:hypothetical protein